MVFSKKEGSEMKKANPSNNNKQSEGAYKCMYCPANMKSLLTIHSYFEEASK